MQIKSVNCQYAGDKKNVHLYSQIFFSPIHWRNLPNTPGFVPLHHMTTRSLNLLASPYLLSGPFFLKHPSCSIEKLT